MWTIDLPVPMKDGSSDQYAINMRSFLLSYPASPPDLDHELRYLADIFRTESILEPVSWLWSKVPSTCINGRRRGDANDINKNGSLQWKSHVQIVRLNLLLILHAYINFTHTHTGTRLHYKAQRSRLPTETSKLSW